MTEYIVNVGEDGAAAQIIEKFGIEETTVYGYHFTGEEIVRCRDCEKSAEGRMFGGDAVTVCTRFETYNHVTEPNGFCSWAKRKVDAHAERLRGEGDGE